MCSFAVAQSWRHFCCYSVVGHPLQHLELQPLKNITNHFQCMKVRKPILQGKAADLIRRFIANQYTPLKLTSNNPSRFPLCGSYRIMSPNQIKALPASYSPPSFASLLPSDLQCSPHFMAASISLPSTFHGSWATSLAGEDRVMLTKSVPTCVHVGRPLRSRPRMGNINEGKGLFAPLVVLTRNIIGRKRFNQLRGKAIALHSQVITEFCKTIGADNKQRQGLIRLAKKNGEKLGFLA